MRKYVHIQISILLLLISGSCINSNSSSEINEKFPMEFVKVSGTNLLNTLGDTIHLKGTNLGNWLVPEGYMFKMEQVNSPRKIDELLYELIGPDSLTSFWSNYLNNYIQYEDIKYLKSIGSNHIRLPFHYKMFTDDLYMGERNAGFKYFDRLIDWCKQEKMYVLLDMHCAPGGQTGDNIDDSYGYPYLFKSKSSQDLLSEIWLKIASRYKDEAVIIGYDIINEPIAHYFNDEIDDLNHKLFLVYKRIVNEIRQVDTKHIIFLNGSNWSGNFNVFEEVLDDNVVYEFHKYWFPVNQEAIQFYIDYRNKYQVPVYIGETGENTDEWISEFRSLLDVNQVPWCFWPYKKMNNTSGIMNFNEPVDYHLITGYAQSDRSSYLKMRENRPDISKVQTALNQFLENCKFENNYVNNKYTKALNFRTDF